MELDKIFPDVLDTPAADEPRLAFAGFIEDMDPDHAALIRLQIDQLRHRLSPELSEPGAAYRRERELLKRLSKRLHFPVRRWVRGFVVQRGFVEGGMIDAADFAAEAHRLVRGAPLLHLRPRGISGVAEAFLARPELGQIRSLSLRMGGIDDAFVVALARCPHLGELRWLDLGQNDLSEVALRALADSRHLRNLRVLGFYGNAAEAPNPEEIDDNGHVVAVTVADLHHRMRGRHGDLPWLMNAYHPNHQAEYWP